MAQLVKTWTFNSTLEDWVLSNTADVTMSRITDDGNPDNGCLQGLTLGRNNTGTGSAEWSGDYVDLGVPADAEVNGVSLKLRRRVANWNVVDHGHWTVESTPGTLVNQQNESGVAAWAEITGNTISGLTLAPSTALTITLSCDLDTGNDKNAGVTFRWDTIELTVDYTPNFLFPTYTTEPADPVGYDTATLKGNLTDLGDATTVDVYFQYRKDGAESWTATTAQTKMAIGTFNEALTGLDQYADYEFRAVSEFDMEGTLTNTYGSILTFKTSLYNGALIERKHYIVGGDIPIKLANPATRPAGTGNGVAFSHDSVYMAVAHWTTPFITIYKRDGDTFTKLDDPADLPTNSGASVSFSHDSTYMAVGWAVLNIYKRDGDTFTKLDPVGGSPTGGVNGVAFSHDSTYMAIAHHDGSILTIYKRDGDVFTRLPDPADIPPNTGRGVAFSHDSTYMAVAHFTDPFVTIYKRDGDTFTKLDDPSTKPAGTAYGVSFSHDSTYMAVVHWTTPFITVYKRDGDVFTKLPNPANLPGANGSMGVDFSHDSTYMAVAHSGTPYVTIYKRFSLVEKIIVAGSSPHNDTVDLTISTEYSYQAEVYLNGVLQTNYLLTAELNLKTAPASVKLEWGE